MLRLVARIFLKINMGCSIEILPGEFELKFRSMQIVDPHQQVKL